jgi:hypothetical protein
VKCPWCEVTCLDDRALACHLAFIHAQCNIDASPRNPLVAKIGNKELYRDSFGSILCWCGHWCWPPKHQESSAAVSNLWTHWQEHGGLEAHLLEIGRGLK